MARFYAPLVLALQHGVSGNKLAFLEYPYFKRVMLNFDHPAPRRVGNAVIIASDRDHAFVADPPLDGQHGIVAHRRQNQQMRLFLGKMFADDPARGRMMAGVGNLAQSCVKLGIEIIQITETATKEQILPDIAERALHLALRLGPIGLASLGRATVMGQQGNQ